MLMEKNVEEKKLLTQDNFYSLLFAWEYIFTCIQNTEQQLCIMSEPLQGLGALRSLNRKVGMKWSFLCKQILTYSVKVIRQSYLI